MAREFAKTFYSSKVWQDCRNEYARDHHYLCERCLSKGLYKTGEIVHHKIELSPENIDDPSVTLNPNNLMLVCRDCHAEIHKLKDGTERPYTIDEFGRVIVK